MLLVAKSDKKDHIISGLDLGTIEKNIINAELGITDIFGNYVQYFANGSGGINLPHIKYRDKIVYILGYDNVARWKKVLGGQVGCVFIDEINIAQIDYVREISGRCDYLMATLNPDNPDLDVYKEYINRSRPLKEYESDYPTELLNMLNEKPENGWLHWYFSFEHNVGLTQDQIDKKIRSYPKGTKIYKNKVLGLRGRSSGLIFNLEERHLIKQIDAQKKKYQLFSLGVDTSYSSNSKDTFALSYGGLTTDGEWVVLETREFNNKDLIVPLTPSDMPIKIDEFLEMCFTKWGFTRSIFIDSADQATILEVRKYVRNNGKNYNVYDAYKKTTNIDRINLQAGWMAIGKFFVVEENNKPYIRECNVYSWKEAKDEPEDGNDHNIQACQYSWLPYKEKVGK
jgi:phage terminase large subunit